MKKIRLKNDVVCLMEEIKEEKWNIIENRSLWYDTTEIYQGVMSMSNTKGANPQPRTTSVIKVADVRNCYSILRCGVVSYIIN